MIWQWLEHPDKNCQIIGVRTLENVVYYKKLKIVHMIIIMTQCTPNMKLEIKNIEGTVLLLSYYTYYVDAFAASDKVEKIIEKI